MIQVLLCFAVLFFFASVSSAHDDGGKPSAQPIVLKWLGNAGWKIEVGKTVILIDPFLTRQEPDRPGGEWISDEEAVLKAIKRADYIFTGHSHADHIGDVPCIANRFGSKVYGSRKTVDIALTAGVAKSQLKTVRGGITRDINDFSVRIIDSVHGVRNPKSRRPKLPPREITRPCPERVPANEFRDAGDTFLYLFTIGNRTILYQSTGGFIADKIADLRADVALLYPMNPSDTENIIKVLQPKTVFVHHFDEWRVSFAEGLPERSLDRARRFTLAVNAIDSNINVITPKYFRPNPIP